MMYSDYEQSFFKSDVKDRESGLRVRQVAVKGEHPGARSAETVGDSSRSYSKTHSTKTPRRVLHATTRVQNIFKRL